MKRKGSAEWRGALRDGHGTVSTESGVLRETRYSFGTRFESGAGTNPEELIAAAHAGCFSMALTPESIRTTATVNLEKTEAGFTINAVHLDVVARVPGPVAEAFNQAAQAAKAGCPVSKLLNAEITLETRLEDAPDAAAPRETPAQ
jgi:osmotically inducible protein OsmC